MYKITNMDVLHLVAKIGNNTETNNNNNTYNNTSSNFFPNNIFNNRRISYDERNIRHRELAYQPEINVNEIKETIFQNLIQIKSILNCGNFQDIINPNNKNNINSSSLLNNNNINNKKTEEFDYNLNFYDLNKRTLQIGEWVDVKDTVENWLDAQVIDINESKKEVLIHYNGWNRRWDEWLPMNSPKIMPFRYHTRQTVITEYTSPFPNKRPNILKFHEKNNDNFLEIFSEIKEVNNLVFNLVEKINENNNINFNIENNNINNNKLENINNDNNKNDINNIIINNNNDNKIDNNDNDDNNNNNNIINAQNNIYFNLKRLLPIMDRLGRLFVDISTFFNYSINSRKLEDISKTFFNNYKEINDILKPFNENEQKTSNDNFLKNFNERERESGTINYVQCNNKFEEKMINKIPIIDTPYTVFKNDNFHHPIIDIYIRPYREPLGLRNNSIFHSIETNTNNNNINNNNNNNINLTNNDTISRNNDINNNNNDTNNLNNNNNNDKDKKNDDNSKDLKNNNDNEKNNNINDDITYFENTEHFNILSNNNNNTNKNNNFYQVETNYNFSIIDSDSKIINNKEFINKKREREE